MTTLEVLQAARALITPEGSFTGEMPGEGQNCIITALYIAASPDNGVEEESAYKALLGLVPPAGVISFAKTHTHAEVLALFDKAIHNASLEGVRD